MSISIKPLSGFLELSPGAQKEFDRIKHIIEETFQRFGFTALDTPVIERSEVLLAKGGGEADKQIYFVNNGITETAKNELAMRFDLTVPLARYVASRQEQLAFPFKRSHVGKVYRGERAQKGRFREFYQCDIDVIGKNSLSVYYDAEIPSVMYHIFRAINIGPFKIKLSNRKLYGGLMDSHGIQVETAQILRIIDKAEKVSRDVIVADFTALGLTDAQIQGVLAFMDIKGTVAQVLAQLEGLGIVDPQFQEGLQELTTVTQTMAQLGVEADYFEIDLGIVRGLDYYTGMVYETILTNSPIVGSICSGGRYEDLASQYSKEKLPGVGMSIGLSRLFWQLQEFGLVGDVSNNTVAQVLVMPDKEDHLPRAIELANFLRAGGVNTDLLLEPMPIKKKFAYVDKLNTPYTVVVKTLADGQEVTSLQYKEADQIVKKTASFDEILETIRG